MSGIFWWSFSVGFFYSLFELNNVTWKAIAQNAKFWFDFLCVWKEILRKKVFSSYFLSKFVNFCWRFFYTPEIVYKQTSIVFISQNFNFFLRNLSLFFTPYQIEIFKIENKNVLVS